MPDRSRTDDLPSPPSTATGWPWTSEGPVTPDSGAAPTITVVVPSLNQGRFLEQTLRSILLQGYPGLELIVVDGGSTDETLSIIRRYEPWIAWWRSHPDRGQAHAINEGWARATGRLLAFLNSDDTYLPGTLARVAEVFRANPTTAVVTGLALVVREDGTPLREYGDVSTRCEDIVRGGRNLFAQPATFVRREALAEVGCLDESMHFAFDFDLWLRLMRFGDFARLSHVLATMRVHPEAKTVRAFDHFFVDRARALRRASHDPHLTATLRDAARTGRNRALRAGVERALRRRRLGLIAEVAREAARDIPWDWKSEARAWLRRGGR